MKRYLLVLSNLELGGAERQALNFAKYLRDNGYEVTILGLADPGIVCKICEKEFIPWIYMPEGNVWLRRVLTLINLLITRTGKNDIWPQGLTLMYSLSRYIKKNKFDVCISYCTYANTILGCIKWFYKDCICVWFQRDAGIFDSNEGYQKRAIQNMDFVLANGSSGKEWIKQAYGLDAYLVYNGVSLKEPQNTDEEWRKKLKVNDTWIVCTMIANLSGAKDHMSLLKALKLLSDSGEQILFVFAGRFDDQYEVLYEYAQKNDLMKYVRFLGQVTDISGLLSVTSICIFGAISEGSPNAIIESAFAGLPVVATDLPEIREVIAEENYEYLVEKNDIALLANKIMILAKDKCLRYSLGKANKEKAMEMFSVDKNYEKIIRVVENSNVESGIENVIEKT